MARSRVDASAFGELYDYYLPRIYGFVVRRVGDRATAEDLTAMTFERALGAVRGAGFRNDAFGGWLYRVASNAVIDHVRRGRRTIPLGVRASDAWGEDAGTAGIPEPGDDAAAAAFAVTLDREVLRAALLRLPDTHRRVIVLKYFDDLDIDEMCGALGCSRQTLAVKVHRALRALKGAVAQETTDAA